MAKQRRSYVHLSYRFGWCEILLFIGSKQEPPSQLQPLNLSLSFFFFFSALKAERLKFPPRSLVMVSPSHSWNRFRECHTDILSSSCLCCIHLTKIKRGCLCWRCVQPVAARFLLLREQFGLPLSPPAPLVGSRAECESEQWNLLKELAGGCGDFKQAEPLWDI